MTLWPAQEAFRVRRKGFWPLTKTGSLLHNFSKQLTHESDGLIFQPAMVRQKPPHRPGKPIPAVRAPPFASS